MKKARVRYIFILLYEAIRLIFVLTAAPQSAAVLPLSWYAGAATLPVPLILCFFLIYNDRYERTFRPLFGAMKILSAVSLAGYIMTDLPYAFSRSVFDGYYSVKILVCTLIIMLIDGIIAFVCFRRHTHATDGTECR